MVAHYVGDRKSEYKLPLALATGVIVGHLVNPYYPRNVLFIWDHMVPKLFATDYQTSVGSEWYPYNSWAMLTMSLVAILSYAAGILLTNREEWKTDKPRLFWFLASTLYFVLMMKSRRFVEYFPPSAIMFFAFAARDRLNGLELSRLVKSKVRVARGVHDQRGARRYTQRAGKPRLSGRGGVADEQHARRLDGLSHRLG
jgi:hypothetical protein